MICDAICRSEKPCVAKFKSQICVWLCFFVVVNISKQITHSSIPYWRDFVPVLLRRTPIATGIFLSSFQNSSFDAFPWTSHFRSFVSACSGCVAGSSYTFKKWLFAMSLRFADQHDVFFPSGKIERCFESYWDVWMLIFSRLAQNSLQFFILSSHLGFDHCFMSFAVVHAQTQRSFDPDGNSRWGHGQSGPSPSLQTFSS